jgi:mRNA interferase RelE/StbE
VSPWHAQKETSHREAIRCAGCHVGWADSDGVARRPRRMPGKTAQALLERMKSVAADPFGAHANVNPLTGLKDRYRLRVGDWRALYRVDRGAGEVVLLDVRKREEAYR